MKGLLIACIVENISTRKDNTVKITLGTNELSQGYAGQLFALQNKLASIYISPETIDRREMEQIDKIDPQLPGKTQSQRIRNTLYLLFTKSNEGFSDFESYYKNKTEKYIEHLKSKIDG